MHIRYILVFMVIVVVSITGFKNEQSKKPLKEKIEADRIKSESIEEGIKKKDSI